MSHRRACRASSRIERYARPARPIAVTSRSAATTPRKSIAVRVLQAVDLIERRPWRRPPNRTSSGPSGFINIATFPPPARAHEGATLPSHVEAVVGGAAEIAWRTAEIAMVFPRAVPSAVCAVMRCRTVGVDAAVGGVAAVGEVFAARTRRVRRAVAVPNASVVRARHAAHPFADVGQSAEATWRSCAVGVLCAFPAIAVALWGLLGMRRASDRGRAVRVRNPYRPVDRRGLARRRAGHQEQERRAREDVGVSGHGMRMLIVLAFARGRCASTWTDAFDESCRRGAVTRPESQKRTLTRSPRRPTKTKRWTAKDRARVDFSRASRGQGDRRALESGRKDRGASSKRVSTLLRPGQGARMTALWEHVAR